ncbi:MAG: ribosome biogenesis GTP-binding protein YihA/YsxC [Methylococcaceae bacterium]|nr:ribosome biogenesis GTP-binding protein YihA/YsxC [Methylococcaceae bacterium]
MNDLYRTATFLLSAPNVKLAPPDAGLEIAFSGRSNAGKSSAINAIASRNSLARTSKTPGRTRQLVFFEIDKGRRLVDLPGYGYAKVPKQVQEQWQHAMEQYFEQRKSLCGIFLIMDIRHPMTPFDQQMIEWCSYCRTPLHVLLTKSDKIKFGAAKTTLLQVGKQLAEKKVRASIQLFSALNKIGIDEARQVLDNWFGIEVDGPDDPGTGG